MLATVEMRWFFPECPLDPADFQGTNSERQERTDWYAMPCHPRCGVKLREGKLETKLFSTDFGLRTIGPISGKLEGWKKWSLEYGNDICPTSEELGLAGWIEVRKVRFLQRFEVDEAGVLHATTTRPGNGCEFECTQLFVAGQSTWTVGFEAVGTAECREKNLVQAATVLLGRGTQARQFTAARSFGYAQWLSQRNPGL